MNGIKLSGEKVEMGVASGRPAGRSLSDADYRTLNDSLYDLLLGRGFSPADAHGILSVRRSPRHRRRRTRELARHAPDLHEILRSYAGRVSHAG